MDKIREVIGPGGKNIRGIIEKTGVKIDIDDSGLIVIASVDSEAARQAMEIIQRMTEEPEIGRIPNGISTPLTGVVQPPLQLRSCEGAAGTYCLKTE